MRLSRNEKITFRGVEPGTMRTILLPLSYMMTDTRIAQGLIIRDLRHVTKLKVINSFFQSKNTLF